MRLRESTMTIVLSSTLIAGGTAGTIALSDSQSTTEGKEKAKSPAAQEIPKEAAEAVSQKLTISSLKVAASDPVSNEVRPTLGVPSVELNLKADETGEETRRLTIPAIQETRNPTADNSGPINLAQAQVTITPSPRPSGVSNWELSNVPWDTKPTKTPEAPLTGNTLSPALQAPANLWAPALVVVKPQKKKSTDENSKDDVVPTSPLNPSIITSTGTSPAADSAPVKAYQYVSPGPDGTYSNIHPVDPNGAFAGRVIPGDTHQGVLRGVIVYFRDPGSPSMYQETGNYGTRHNMMQQAVDKYRSFIAAMSGGTMDIKYDIVDLPVTAKPGGGTWERNDAADTLLPTVGYNLDDYHYAVSYYDPDLSTSVMTQPSGTGSLTYGGGWSNIGGDSNGAGYILHELGHNLGLSHAGAFETYASSTAPSPGYTYNFTTGTYTQVAVTDSSSLDLPASPSLPSLTLGAVFHREYGNPFNLQALNGGFSPREKQSLGWLEQSHFADINSTVAPNTTGVIRLYDDMADITVVTKGTGSDLQYGVARGYQNVNYGAYLTRQGYAFHVTSAGPTPTGVWTPYEQLFDFYYRSAGNLYPGQENVITTPDAVVVTLNGNYLGYLTKGQVFLEKYVNSSLFIPSMSQGLGVLNLDDGSTVANAPMDLLAYNNGHPGAPMNPDRQRSVWYEVTYANNGIDATGHWADLSIRAFSGAQVYGWQWDAINGSAGAQDGSGTWTAGAGNNWRSVSLGIDNQNWTQLEDATFGVGSGAAGTVTLNGAVSANSLTFNAPGSGRYTLTGGSISIDIGGVMTTASATIASNVNLLSTQFWSVDANRELAVNGVITPGTGHILYKNGQGSLSLGGLNTWTSDLRVVEGLVQQNVSQIFSSNADLRIEQGAVYQINSGTLHLLSGSTVAGMPIPAESNLLRNFAVGTLRLSSTTGSAANPEVNFVAGSSIATMVQLDAGTHFITNNGNSNISGDISGAGGITLSSGSDGNSLNLSGTNTFTGDINITRGILALTSGGSLSGSNNLIFNIASGQKGEFRTGFNDTTLKSLATAGTNAGATTVSNNSTYDATLTVNQSTSTTYSGAIINGSTGKLALNKTGTGTLTLSGGNSTYTGGTTVTQGTLRIAGSGSIGTGAVTLAGGTLSVDQRQGLSLKRISGSPMDTTTPGTGGVYTSDFSPLHTQNLVNGTFAYTGKIWLTSGHWSFGESFDDGAFLKINGTTLLNDTYYGNNTYSPYLNIAADGWYDIDLRVYNSGGGGPYATGTWDNVKGVGIKKGDPTGNGTDYTAFNPYALGIKLRDLNTVANAVNLTAASTIEILDADAIQAETVLSGIVSGSGALNKTGSGILTLENASNNYTGAVTVSGGTLAAGATNAFSAASAITLGNTSGVTLDLRGFNQTVGSLAGGGTTGGTVTLGTATLTAGGDNTSTAFAGVIAGTGGLTKAGTGTMSLSGQNTYTGATKVTDGVLNLDYSANALTGNLVHSDSALVLDGGMLHVTGRNGATIAQNFASLTLLDGANGINLVRNGAASLDVNIGAITRSGSGTIDFSGLTGATAGARIITTSGSASALLDGGAQWATYNGTDWASRDATGYIVAYTGYYDIYNGTAPGPIGLPNDSTANVRIRQASSGFANNTLAASAAIKSLLMSADTTAATVDITGKTLSVEAIASTANAKRLTLGTVANSGTLTSSTNALQIISNNVAASEGIVVNSVIANNGATPLAVSVSGGVNGGTTYFTAANTYSGGTTITNNGTLNISAAGALGTGAATVTSGSTLILDSSVGNFAVANAIGGAGAMIKIGTNTVTLSGTNNYTGITTISDGTLRVNNGGTLGTGEIIINNAGANLLYSNAVGTTVTLANTISGIGSLTKGGVGTLILTGTNSYGNTVVDSGTLQVGNGGTVGSIGTGSVSGIGGTLAFDRSDAITVANTIGGTVSLAQIGDGTVTLTGANTYSGTTSITSGARLNVGAGGTTGTLGTGTVTNNGTLAFNRSGALAVSAAIGGTGSVIHEGSGTTTLTGANTYSGTTNVSGGTLKIDTGGSLGTGAVSVSGTLAFNQGGLLTLANTFDGFGAIVQSGAGTTVLSADNAFFFGTATINAGVLQIGNGGTTGALSNATIVNNGMLTFKRSDDITPSSIISGTGSLTQSGSGTLILSKNNTYAGTTTIDAGGTLQVGNAGTSGTLGAGAVTDNGTLTFNRTNNFTVANAISGSGKVVQAGSGTTTISSANTYSGGTDINSGVINLIAGASLGSGTTTVNTGGQLQFGTGGADGVSFTFANNFALNGGKLSFNSWYTTATVNGSIDSGIGATIDCARGDSVVLNGLVTGSGTISITGGSGGDFGRVVFNNAANTYNGTVTIGGSSANVTIGNATALRHATLNLAPSAGSPQVAYASGLTATTIGGLAGTTLGRLQLKNGSSAVALTVDQASNTTFAGIAYDTGSLTKAGAGTLTLTNANTYTGGTTVSGGILALDFSATGAAASNILASSGAVTLNGGTLRIIGKSGQNGTVQTFAGLTSGSASSTLELVRNGATTLDVNVGALSFGTGAITFAGLTGTTAGARVITTTNAGANDGASQLSATSALWNGGGWASVQQSGGVNYVVQWNGVYSDVYTNATGGNSIVIPNSGANVAVRILENGVNTTHNSLAASSTTINSLLMMANVNGSTIDMAATDKLTILGAGNVAMTTDAQSLTIGNVAGQGTLTAGNSGAATLNLSNANAASILTVNATIADNGSGAVSLSTAGKVTLNGALSYTGSTTVGTGSTLTLNASLGAGNYAGAVTNNGVMNLTTNGAQTLSGTLGGTGVWNNSGSGTTTVSGNFGGSATWNQNGTGSTLFTGVSTGTGPINITAGTFTLGGAGRLGTSGNYSGTITNESAFIISTTATQTISGRITGTGSLTINKTSGDLALRGSNDYSGGTTINAGSIRLNNSNTAFGTGTVTFAGSAFFGTDSGSSALTLGNAIVINSGVTTTIDAGYADITLSGALSGAGNLRQNSSGTLTLAGSNTYAGTTTISSSAGTLKVTGTLGSGSNYAAGISNSGKINFASASDQKISGVISGSGGQLYKSGTGSLTLAAANTMGNGMFVTGGTLITAHTSSLGTGSVSVTGATLQIGDGVNNGVTLGSAATLAMAADATLKLGASDSKVTMGSGAYTLTAGMNLDITGVTLGVGSYTVISGTSASSAVGTWSASADLIGGDLANFAYTFAKVGNDAVFTVTAVPEPATYGLLGAASLAAVALVRRRRRAVVLP